MRPVAHQQSALRAPLNRILATEANVRVLRVLAHLSAPIGASEIARQAQLQRSSVHRSLKTLEQMGVIEFVGAGPRSQVSIRQRMPLHGAIRGLFESERHRYDQLLVELKRAADALKPPPQAVWVQGPVARGADQPEDPVIICVVDASASLASTSEALRNKVTRLEEQFDVLIEVRGRTKADLELLDAAEDEDLLDAISLLGVPPGAVLRRQREKWMRRNTRAHAAHDARALRLADEVAAKLKRNPGLISEAREYVERRWRSAGKSERKELSEWRRILRNASPSRLRKLLTDPGERSTRLRQTMPFVGLLTTDVRNKP